MLVASLPQYQPYHPFQPTSFHSTFPHSYQQPTPYLMSNALVAADKVESEKSKVTTLDIKHKTIWDTLVQMDPNPSTLNSWIRNQITNIKKYKEKNSDSPFWKYKEDRYIAFFIKLGLDYPAKYVK